MNARLLIIFAGAVTLAGCDTPESNPAITTPQATESTTGQAALVDETLKKMDVPMQIFATSATKQSMVTGRRGTVIMVAPDDLETEDGKKPEGSITVELKELTSSADLVRAQAQTVSDGRLLVSGGSYYVNMTASGKPLRIKQNRSLKVALPRFTNDGMTLFYGQRDNRGQMNWKPAQKLSYGRDYGNSDTSIMVYNSRNYMLVGYVGNDTTYKRDTAKLNAMGRKKTLELIAVNRIQDSIQERNDSLNKAKWAVASRLNATMYDVTNIRSFGWINCDKFYNGDQKSNITYSIAPADSINYAHIYLVFKDINSMTDYNYFASEGIYPRTFESIPIGYKARLIGVAYKKNQLYTSSIDITVAPNQHTLLTWQAATENSLKELFSLN